jgi:putative phosphoribosyl transferase
MPRSMLPKPLFHDRAEAGRALAQRLKPIVRDQNVLVLALPRGGVPVGFEVAQILHADLDVFIVRKLGVPGHEELAMGAIASGGIRVLNYAVIEQLGIPKTVIDRVKQHELQEIRRRENLYREGRPPLSPAGRTVVLVDDGLATGATMLAAVRAVRTQNTEQIIVGVPVASREACDEIGKNADAIVCVATPEPFHAVGVWYEDFSQTSDDEVGELLERAARQHAY